MITLVKSLHKSAKTFHCLSSPQPQRNCNRSHFCLYSMQTSSCFNRICGGRRAFLKITNRNSLSSSTSVWSSNPPDFPWWSKQIIPGKFAVVFDDFTGTGFTLCKHHLPPFPHLILTSRTLSPLRKESRNRWYCAVMCCAGRTLIIGLPMCIS